MKKRPNLKRLWSFLLWWKQSGIAADHSFVNILRRNDGTKLVTNLPGKRLDKLLDPFYERAKRDAQSWERKKAAARPLLSTQHEEPKIAKDNADDSRNPQALPQYTTTTVATANCKTPSADTISYGDTASLAYSEMASQITTSGVPKISSKGLQDKNQLLTLSFEDLEPLDWKDGGQPFRYDSLLTPMHEKGRKHESSNSTTKTTTTMLIEPLPYRYEHQPQTATLIKGS